MKYKLIKLYPGSPPLDTIIYIKNNCFYFQSTDSHFTSSGCSIVINYPEYWLPEDKWEIISEITNSPIGSKHWFNTILGFHIRLGEYLTTDGEINDGNIRQFRKTWGEELQNGSNEIVNYFKDKLK